MACPIDHSASDALPAFLCRGCNPDTADNRHRILREIAFIEQRLQSITLPRAERESLGKALQSLQLEELLA